MFKQLKSLLTTEIGVPKKEEIPQSSIELHSQSLAEIRVLAPIMKAFDSKEFENKDVKFYFRLKSYLQKGIEKYQGLNDSAELLRIAIQAKDSFLKIEQTELRYRSLKQQEYYEYVLNLLQLHFADKHENNNSEGNFVKVEKKEETYSVEDFKNQIEKKAEEIIPTIKTEEGQTAVKDYLASLKVLAAEKEIGLNLLYRFKKFQLTDFSVLKIISEMVVYLRDKQLGNIRAMMDLVEKNMETFQQIGKIIGLSSQKSNQETYATLLQYICLSEKSEPYYEQYAKLIGVITEWEKFYQSAMNIREKYPASKFDIPDEFKKEIPGVNIYEKYQSQLET